MAEITHEKIPLVPVKEETKFNVTLTEDEMKLLTVLLGSLMGEEEIGSVNSYELYAQFRNAIAMANVGEEWEISYLTNKGISSSLSRRR